MNTSTMSIDHRPPPRTEDEWGASMRYADEHVAEIEPPDVISPSTGFNLSAFLWNSAVETNRIIAEIYRRAPKP